VPGKRPRCHKPMKQYSLDRPRAYDPAPVCGRPRGHPGNCLTTETYEQCLQRRRDYRAAQGR
jgi:hypothetical protein